MTLTLSLSGRARWAVAALLLATALVVLCAVLMRPLEMPAVGYDTAFSIVYFDRLMQGRFVEVMPATTPKPLVTLLSGGLYHLGGWGLVAWSTFGAFAAGVVAAAALARRLGGPVAAAFTAVGLAGTALLLLDADLAYATPWALLGWAAAGLAVTSARPRYLLAGVALLVAALFRIETFLLLGAATGALFLGHVLARQGLVAAPPRGAALLLVGWLALPVMLVHDQLTFGDPLLWLKLAHINSTANMTPGGLLRLLAARYQVEWGLVALGAVGLVDLARRALWVPLIGVAALGFGNLALLLVLTLTRTYVSFRYYLPTDIAVVFAASLGTAAIVGWLAGRAGLGPPMSREPAGGIALSPSGRDRLAGPGLQVGAHLVGGFLAVALIRPYAPLDAASRATYTTERRIVADFERALPALEQEIARLPAPVPAVNRPLGAGDRPGSRSDAPAARVRVPGILWPRATVDLGEPLWDIAPGPPVPQDPSTFRIDAPIVVYFDTIGLGDEPRWKPLVVTSPTQVGHVRVVPVVASDGIWVERLEPAG